MEKSTSRNPKPNEFVIPDGAVYEPIPLKELDIDNRICPICKLWYCVTEEDFTDVDPVKTVCGHVLCRKCITTWLNPLDFEDTNFLSSGANNEYCEEPKNSCPICQNVFFPKVDYSEPMEGLAARLWLWDTAYRSTDYASTRVARSEKEEYTRDYLWRFLHYCFMSYTMDTIETNDDVKVEYLRSAQRDVLYFAHKLKTQSLTPLQEGLRKSLEELGKIDPADDVFYHYFTDSVLGPRF